MPVPACCVARALFRNAFSPSAVSPVMTVRQVSTGQPGCRKSRWKSPIRALPRQPGHTSGNAAAESTRTATSPPSGSWNSSPSGLTDRARPGEAHCEWMGSCADHRLAGRSRSPAAARPAGSLSLLPIFGAISSAASDSSSSGGSRRACAPADASVPSSARRNASSAVSDAGPG